MKGFVPWKAFISGELKWQDLSCNENKSWKEAETPNPKHFHGSEYHYIRADWTRSSADWNYSKELEWRSSFLKLAGMNDTRFQLD